MTKDRTRTRWIRAETAVTGPACNDAAPMSDAHEVPGTGHRSPCGVPVADDPLGLGDGIEPFTAPLTAVTVLAPGDEGLAAAQVIADAVDRLAGPVAGWHRASA